MITYYLFIYKDKVTEKFDIPLYTHYKLNSYDFNDLNLEKAKRYYPLDFGFDINKKEIKYLKAINDSLDKIRLLLAKDKETIYNIQNRNPTPLENNPEPFQFIAKYLVNKINQLSSNLYNVTFVEFNKIQGEEIDEQYKVLLNMKFNVQIRKEEHYEKPQSHFFNVTADAIINKPNPLLKTQGNVFFRTIFVDNKYVNDFIPYNYFPTRK
jgi:hypothetical protein